MKLPRIFSVLVAMLILSTATACTSRFSNAVDRSDSLPDSSASSASTPTQSDSFSGSTPSGSATETNQPKPTAQTTTASQRPSTKTETISVEGESTQVTLKLFDEASEIFSTYYPEDDFVAESLASDEGTGARFYFNAGGTKNENVYVHLFFPAKATTLEQMKTLVTQERGLLQSNQWQVVNRSEEVPYSWAKEKIVFEQRTGSEPIGGQVYIGEADGKAFYVITHYPMEYAEGFSPRSDLILKNLQVRHP